MTAPTSARGYVDDTAWFGQVFGDYLEQIPDLLWPTSVVTYGQMRRDPQLTAVLAGYTLPIRRATWQVDPSGCRPEVAALVADGVGLPVAGVDASPTGARVRGVRWAEHLRMALLHLTFGHIGFETLYAIDGGQARLVGLPERMPQTIAEILVSSTGEFGGIKQYGTVGSRAPAPTLPADRLVWYVHDREGANYAGTSVLRPAYAAWLLKREMQRVLATSNRRFGMGVPVMEALPGTNPTPAQMSEAQQLASAIRVGDQGGAATPPGFTLALKGLTGSVPDTLAFIRWLDQQMSRMALAGFIDLGETPNGSRALGAEFVDLFLLTTQTLAEYVACEATTQIAARIVAYNWGEDEPVPAIVVGDVGSRREVTAEAIQILMASGAVAADPNLEAWVRREWRLPPREATPTPPEPQPAGRPTQARARTPRPRRSSAAKDDTAPSPLRRGPTVVEAAAGTDFEALQGEWVDALDQLLADWDTISAAQRQQILDQIAAAVDDDQIDALAALAVNSEDAAGLLAERMRALADAAADRMRDEAQSQGVTVPKTEPDGDRLDQIAVTLAALAAGALATSAAKKAVQAWTAGATAAEVTAAVGDFLDSLTGAGLADYLGGGLSAAQNEGRLAVLRAAPTADYYASEILDRNTCQPCQDVDGDRFDNLDGAESAYANGGYRDCLGGLRCRGIVISVWES